MDGTEVPLRLLMMGTQKEGRRLPKREKPAPPLRARNFSNWGPKASPTFHPGVVQIDSGSKLAHEFSDQRRVLDNAIRNSYRGGVGVLAKGNLPLMEYRFWSGARNEASRFAVCRGCRHSTHDSHQRKAHMEDLKCTDLLVKAYRRLITDEVCVICDKETSLQKWGVPICSPVCTEVWMFNMKRPAALDVAIELVYTSGQYAKPHNDKATVFVPSEAEARALIGRDY